MGFNKMIGEKTALSNNSTKYGYSMQGLCLKTASGAYRATDGTIVNMAVSTDVSHIVKEKQWLKNVVAGDVIVFNRECVKVLSNYPINDLTAQMKFMYVETGAIAEEVVDTSDKAVDVFYDTFVLPNKAIDATAATIHMNEFTPKQLFELRTGKTTLEELRKPMKQESLEDVLTAIVKGVIEKAKE